LQSDSKIELLSNAEKVDAPGIIHNKKSL
jgi:hypothetical protein